MTLIDVNPRILQWAQRRSGHSDTEMRNKFAAWDLWLQKEKDPTFSQLEDLAEYTHVPFGYFFLTEPPIEDLPIPDFRVGRATKKAPASGDLLDTIYLNQRRQSWYEEYLMKLEDPEPLPFVGSAQGLDATAAATLITEALDYQVTNRTKLRPISKIRSHLVTKFEELGGLVIFNSMVGNNTKRMLDLEEFRGFTLQSPIAPLIFINANDTVNGQIFSFLHECAHVWNGGGSGVSAGGDPLDSRDTHIERWCDQVAAEVAVPTTDLRDNFNPHTDLTSELDRLSDRYYCSTLVILLQLRSANIIKAQGFNEIYGNERTRILNIMGQQKQKREGGNFYLNQRYHIGEMLSHAIIRDTKLGATPMTEALRLLTFKSIPVFDKYARKLEEV
jgi:hypothetical protein